MSSGNFRSDTRKFFDDPSQFTEAEPEAPSAPPEQAAEVPELRRRILNRLMGLPFGSGLILPAPSISPEGKFGFFNTEPLVSQAVRSGAVGKIGEVASQINKFTPTGVLTSPVRAAADTAFGRGVGQASVGHTEVVLEELMGRIAEVTGDDESAAAWLEVAAETQAELDESVEPGFAAGAGRLAGILVNPMYALAFGLGGRVALAPAKAIAERTGPLIGKAIQRAGGTASVARKAEALQSWAIQNAAQGAAGFSTLAGIEGFAGEGTVEGTVEGVIEGVAVGAPLGLLFGTVAPAFRALQRAGKTLVEGGARRRLGLPPEGDLTPEKIQAAFKKRATQSHPDNGGADAEFAKDAWAYKELMLEAKAVPKVTEPTEMPFPERGGQKFLKDLGEGRTAALEQEAAQAAAKVVPPSAPPPVPAIPTIGRRGLLTLRPLQEGAALAKRWLTSAGDLPEKAFKLIQQREGAIRGRTKRIEFLLKDWRVAAKEVYPRGKPKPVEMGVLRDFMQGNASLQDVPKGMRPVMSKLRTEIDAHSRELIGLGLAEGRMAGIIDDNLGVYTTRAYRVFDDPKWAQKVPQRVRNRAKAFLRDEYPQKNEAEIEGLIEQLLFEGKAADSPMSWLRSGKLGSKDLSIFKRRKAIPDEIRALWGEIKDPRELYALSVAKMGQLIENQRFLGKTQEAGVKGGWLRTPEEGPIVSEQFGPLSKRIAADESSAMSPLNGHFTSPEIAKAFDRQFSTEALPTWLRLWMRANSTVKFSKIVLDNVTQIRNWVGNMGFAMAQGHAASFGRGGIFGKNVWRTITTEMGSLKGDAWRLKVERLRELGVLHDSARAGELRAMLSDASKHPDVNEFAVKGLRPDKSVIKGVTALYSAGDDFWKIMAFENEMKRYAKAKPNWTTAELEEHAAGIVRNTYPTYSLVPPAIRGLRRVPLVGPFVSFSSEVFRTQFQTFRLIAKENKDPALRGIAAQRIAGMAAVATGLPAATMAGRFLSGTSREDDAALRRFMPEYVKNHQLMHMGANEAGEYRTIDISYNDPHEMLRTPLVTFMSGGDEDKVLETMKEATLELFEPFYNEELLAGAVVDLARNQTAEGRSVWNPADDPVGQGIDAAEHLGRAVEPGVFRNIRRFEESMDDTPNTDVYGEKFKPETEILRNLTGLNVMRVNVPRSFDFNVRRNRRGIEDSQKLLLTAMGQQDITDQELVEVYNQSNKSRRAAFLEIHLDVKAATGLGAMDLAQVEDALLRSGFSGLDTANIVDGTYTPYEPTARFGESIEESLAESGADRMAVRTLFERRRMVIDTAALLAGLEQELDNSGTLVAEPAPSP